jgi:hypothetical protein
MEQTNIQERQNTAFNGIMRKLGLLGSDQMHLLSFQCFCLCEKHHTTSSAALGLRYRLINGLGLKKLLLESSNNPRYSLSSTNLETTTCNNKCGSLKFNINLFDFKSLQTTSRTEACKVIFLEEPQLTNLNPNFVLASFFLPYPTPLLRLRSSLHCTFPSCVELKHISSSVCSFFLSFFFFFFHVSYLFVVKRTYLIFFPSMSLLLVLDILFPSKFHQNTPLSHFVVQYNCMPHFFSSFFSPSLCLNLNCSFLIFLSLYFWF